MSIKLKHSGGNSVSLNPPTSAPTSSEVAFKLPTSDGSAGQVLQTDGSGNLSWVNPSPITVANTWRLTNSDTHMMEGVNSVITANWAEDTTTSYGKIGSSLSQSSGVFTFPTTGMYLIIDHFTIEIGNADDYGANVYMEVTSDGTNFAFANIARTGGGLNGEHSTTSGHSFFDVTNTSTHKIRFQTDSFAANTRLRSYANAKSSYFTAIRIGDT